MYQTIFILSFILFMKTLHTDGQELPLPYTCTTTTTQCQPGVTLSHIVSSSNSAHVKQGRPGKRGAAGLKGDRGQKGEPCQCDIADEKAMAVLRKELENVKSANRDLNRTVKKMEEHLQLLTLPSNCGEYLKYKHANSDSSDESVEIYPWKQYGSSGSVSMNCTLFQVDNEGWIIIQKRFDGSVDFYRDWETYARGFGENGGEFWLGLRNIHLLTSLRSYKLRIELKFQSGSIKYAEYSTFNVGNEETNFKLAIGGFNGDTDDRMANHNGHAFTTFDVDHDKNSVNCAVYYKGAWWYNSCYHANLNGKYNSDFDWPHGSHLASSTMKIRI